MIEVSENTAAPGARPLEWSARCLERLARCRRLSTTWRLYLAHNTPLQKLLEQVTALSYRDCVQQGLKAQADLLVQVEAYTKEG
jgi:hypothetical protein